MGDPVTLECSHETVELSRDACEKLVRRIRHLGAARSIVDKLGTVRPSAPIELAHDEKGLLVVAIAAWLQDVGRDRVPGGVLRLRTALVEDLRGAAAS
jgi:hypothetical protein